MQVPHEAMHPGVRRQTLRAPDPPRRDIETRVRCLRRVVAREPSYHGAPPIENLQENRPCRRAREIVVEHGAVGRIGRGRLVDRKGRVRIFVPAHPHGSRRAIQIRARGRAGGRLGQLAERGDVVQDPERPAVRGHHEIAVVHHQVAHGGDGQVEPQRLPTIAVVRRDVHPALGAGVQEPAARGILPHGVHHLVGGDARDDFRPRDSAVLRAIHVRSEVIEPEAIYGGVRHERVEVRGFEQRDLAPRREARGCDVPPRLPAVVGHVNQPVVGPDPNETGLPSGRCDRVDHAPMLALLGVERGERAQSRGHVIRRACQVRTDGFPAPPARGRPKQHVRAEVQDARIDWREEQRHGPYPAVLAHPHRLG